jgi:hypothetical protein
MSRPGRARLTAIAVGAAGAMVAVGAATASPTPQAQLHGGTGITARVTGERPGSECRIQAHGVNMPWQPVAADGAADLDTGKMPAGRYDAQVVCAPTSSGLAARAVGRPEDVYTGRWAAADGFLHRYGLEFLTPRDRH